MQNIDLINIRYRGPSESRKNNKIMNDTDHSLNELITKIEILLNLTDEISTEIVYNVRRRSNQNGAT